MMEIMIDIKIILLPRECGAALAGGKSNLTNMDLVLMRPLAALLQTGSQRTSDAASANNSMKTLHYLWSSEEIHSLSLQMTVGSELLTF